MSRRPKRSASGAQGGEAEESDGPAKAIKQEPIDPAPPLAVVAPAAAAPAPGEAPGMAELACATCGQAAKRRCAACGLILCVAHARSHEDERADHYCPPLSVAARDAPPPPPTLPPVRCGMHERSPDLYCVVCEKLLCDQCVSEHNGHALHTVERVAAEKCAALRVLMAEAQTRAQALLARRAEAAAALAELTRNQEAVAADLEAATAALHRAVDERHAALKRELAAFRAAEEERVAADVARSDEAAAAFQRAVAEGDATLASADPRHALRLGSALRGWLVAVQEPTQRVRVGRAALVANVLPAATIGSLAALRLIAAEEAHSQALAARVAGLIDAFKEASEELLRRVREAGVEVKDAKALFDWSAAEARRGNPPAHYLLARCYDFGVGVARNPAKAVACLTRGAELGDAESQVTLGRSYNDRGLPESDPLAFEWYCKAAAQGNANAMNVLGLCFEAGVGIAQDTVQAAVWYQRAADRDCLIASYNLACLREKTGDKAKAIALYRRAAELGVKDAQYRLGEMSEAEKDLAAATMWYERAAKQGLDKAKKALARLRAEAPSSERPR